MESSESKPVSHFEIQQNNNESFEFHNSLKDSVILLKNSEISLFITFLINFSSSIQYYILVTLIPLYFSNQHSYSDLSSGLVFGGFGITIGVSSLFLSSKMDKISFDGGLSISFILGIIGFLLLLLKNEFLSLLSVFIFQSLSCSIAWPFAEYGIKQFSNPQILNLTNSCFFIVNYSAGIFTGLLIDSLWVCIEDKAQIFLFTASVGIIFLLVALVGLKHCRKLSCSCKSTTEFRALWKSKQFWRFVLLIFLLTLLRSMSFGHLDATLPKYLTRVQGNNAHFGIMLAIHSTTMILALFLLTSLTYIWSSFKLINFGAFLGCVGCIFIILSDSLFACILFVVTISVGESIWVPRLLDYTDQVAPEGHEGVYLAMSNCPFYFGMLLTGSSSGFLLQTFCPDDEDVDSCSNVWVFVFFSALAISGLLFILRKVILGRNFDTREGCLGH